MAKVNLYYVEIPVIPEQDRTALMWGTDGIADMLGSHPKHEGEVAEGMAVPQGKTWLFPLGGNVMPILKRFPMGIKHVVKVNV